MARALDAGAHGLVRALGIRADHLRLRAHDADELSHYSTRHRATSSTSTRSAGRELEGIANRGDFDLTQHAKFSGEKLEYFDPQTKERYVPHVIEPAAGVGRTMLALLCDAYDEDDLGGEHAHRAASCTRAWRRSRSPCCRCVRKDGQPELAREIHAALRGAHRDRVRRGRLDRQALPPPGRDRHAVRASPSTTRSLEDRTVTLRDRDTLEQERVAIDDLPALLGARLTAPWRSPKLS